MSKFDREMKRAIKEIEVAIEKTIRGGAIELFSEIVLRTPVGNSTLWKNDAPPGYVGGRLRGNWQASIDNQNLTELDVLDSSGTSTVSKGTTEINKYKLEDTNIWFSNNLPYAERVEHGWSKQRPNGMVRTTVKLFEPLINKAVRKHKI